MCLCGCGGYAPIAKQSHTQLGYVRGLPVRYIAGHQPRGGNGGASRKGSLLDSESGLKRCSRCLQYLAADLFGANKQAADGLYPQCLECRRKAYYQNHEVHKQRGRESHAKNRSARLSGKLKQAYGITAEQRDQLIAAQDGRCAICQEKPESLLHVDHDHSSGAIRGMLCGRCNTGIGLFKDDPERLAKAIRYLERRVEP